MSNRAFTLTENKEKEVVPYITMDLLDYHGTDQGFQEIVYSTKQFYYRFVHVIIFLYSTNVIHNLLLN